MIFPKVGLSSFDTCSGVLEQEARAITLATPLMNINHQGKALFFPFREKEPHIPMVFFRKRQKRAPSREQHPCLDGIRAPWLHVLRVHVDFGLE